MSSPAKRAAYLLCGIVIACASGCHHGGMYGGHAKFPGSCHVKAPLQKHGCGGAKCGPVQKAACCGTGYGGLCHGWLAGWFHGRCGHAGCGPISSYEWLNDPPDCCDPCHEHYGFWTGPRACSHNRVILDPLLWILALKHKHCVWGPCPYGYEPYGPCLHGDCGACACNVAHQGDDANYDEPSYAQSIGPSRERVAGRLSPDAASRPPTHGAFYVR